MSDIEVRLREADIDGMMDEGEIESVDELLAEASGEIRTLRAKVAELEDDLLMEKMARNSAEKLCGELENERTEARFATTDALSRAVMAETRVRELEAGSEAVEFTCHGNSAPAYSCNKPGDMSGTYYTTPQPVKVPEGWRMWAGDNGLMCIQHPEYGGTAARDSEDATIAEVALHHFIKAMLSAQDN